MLQVYQYQSQTDGFIVVLALSREGGDAKKDLCPSCAERYYAAMEAVLNPTVKCRSVHGPVGDVSGIKSIEIVEQEHVLATMEACGKNKSLASRLLGIERSTLDRKLAKYKAGAS